MRQVNDARASPPEGFDLTGAADVYNTSRSAGSQSFEDAILTTNAGSAIDPAFRRRMSFRLTFPFPDDEALWKVHLPTSVPRVGALDLGNLARRYRMSGGFIRNAASRACFLASDEGSGITQGHLERAIRSEFREIGKLGETGVLE